MSLTIISLNTRGLGDPVKRRAIFNYYRSRGNTICLQETHSSPECELSWRSEWGGEIQFSHGTSSVRGVCILFSKDNPYRIVNTKKDQEGRVLICELENKDNPLNRVTLCNLYGPNKDRPDFFKQSIDLSLELAPELIFVGDFNMVQDVELDRKGSIHTYPKAHEALMTIMEQLELVDIWRVRNEKIAL